MIERRCVVEVVTRLYTAAGRNATEAELALFADALGAVEPDDAPGAVEPDVAIEACRRAVAAETWGWRPPSPALLLDYVGAVRRERRARQPAIPSSTGHTAPGDAGRAGLAAARAELRQAALPRARSEAW